MYFQIRLKGGQKFQILCQFVNIRPNSFLKVFRTLGVRISHCQIPEVSFWNFFSHFEFVIPQKKNSTHLIEFFGNDFLAKKIGVGVV